MLFKSWSIESNHLKHTHSYNMDIVQQECSFTLVCVLSRLLSDWCHGNVHNYLTEPHYNWLDYPFNVYCLSSYLLSSFEAVLLTYSVARGYVCSAVLKLGVDKPGSLVYMWHSFVCTCLNFLWVELDSWLWHEQRPENVTSPTRFRLQATGCRLTWPFEAIDLLRTRDLKIRCSTCKIILFRNVESKWVKNN